MNKVAFGRRINTARKDQKITSEKLSELCNINATYLRQIESGKKTPSLPVFIEICRQLKVSPNYLLVDCLEDNECSDISEVMELLRAATPSQIKVVTAMLKSALQTIQGAGEQT